MSRLRVLVLFAIAVGLFPALPAQAAASRPGKVLIISLPSVTWEDVSAAQMPNLHRLADDWSVGALSIRTVGAKTDQSSAFATIGSGNRSRAGGERPRLQGDASVAPLAIAQPDESLKVRGIEQVARDNRDLSFEAEIGALGDALMGAGITTGVVGNSDGGFIYPTSVHRQGAGRDRRRFGALALTDSRGAVRTGAIGDDLTIADPSTANGFRTDMDRWIEEANRTVQVSRATLVEISDTYREGLVLFEDLRDSDEPDENSEQRLAALRRDDALLGKAVGLVDLGSDTVLILGTTGLGPTQTERLTVALLAGVGADRHGWLTSPTTLRDGLLTLPDVAPGILKLFGQSAPSSMTGQSFESISGPVVGRVEKLRDIQGAALFHIKGVGAFFTLFVLLQIGLYYLAARRLRTKPSGEMPWIQRFSLAFMAVPVGTLILAAVWSTEWNPATAALVLVAACSLITFAALKGPWARTPAGSPAFVCAFTVAVISLDLLTGAHLQLSSLIGYSPIVAGRFYGLGNLTFAVLAASSILLAAEAGVRLGRKGLFVAGAIGGAVVVLDGLPAFGADLGGIIAMVPAFGVLMIVLLGRKPSVRLLVGLVVLAGGVAFLAGYLDSLRPASSQTHLGRFVARLVEQGPGGVQEIVVRKAQANLSVLTQSVLTLSIPTAIFFLIILLRRPYGRLRAAMQTEAGLRAGLIATPVAMVIGFAVNDSGIAIPAMGLGMIVPYCLATIQGIRAPAEATQATK